MRGAPHGLRLVPGNHAGTYFERMAARPDCVMAIAFGSQAEIDAIGPRQKPYDPVLQKKRPMVYDATEQAVGLVIHPPESTDTQQLWPKLAIDPGESAFFTFDLKMDAGFAWRQDGDMVRHKAQQIDGPGGAPLFTVRTFYREAAVENAAHGTDYVAYQVLTSNAKNRVIPPRTGSTEYLEPRLAKFFLRTNVWSRLHVAMVDVCAVKDAGTDIPLSQDQRDLFPNGRVMRLSYWQSDVTRPPVLTLRDGLVLVPDRVALLRLEWDTGTDKVPTQDVIARAWHRWLVQIRNPTDVLSLLEQPSA